MWICYKHRPENLMKRWIKIGQIDLPSDCFGDSLYAYMIGKGIIDNLENYKVKGDDLTVSVVGKHKRQGQFLWKFYEIYNEAHDEFIHN